MRFATTDAELKQTMERMEADQSSFGPALQDLGLKLEALKAPVEIVIVDRAAKTSTENWRLKPRARSRRLVHQPPDKPCARAEVP